MSRCSRTLLILLAAALMLTVCACWVARDSHAALRREAERAAAEGRLEEVTRVASELDQRGWHDEASLLRAAVLVRSGKTLLARSRQVQRHDLAETVSRTQLDLLTAQWGHAGPGGAAVICDPLNWPPFRAAQARADERRQLAERASAAFLAATRELRHVPEDRLDPQATLLLAEALTNLGELGRPAPLPELVRRLHHLTSTQPDHLEAHRRLAQIYIDLNAVRPALAELKEVARLDPNDGRPCRFMGLVLRDTLREGEAIDAYEEALRRRLEPHVAGEVREELAQLLVLQGFPQRALAVLEGASPAQRATAGVRAIAAAAMWSLNQRADARQLVEAALRDDPTLPTALRLKAQIELTEDQPETALKLLDCVLQNDPADEKARSLLLEVLRATGDVPALERETARFDKLTARLRELTELGRRAHSEPWNGEVRLAIGKTWLELGRRSAARSWLRAALAADPRLAEAHRLLQELDVTPK
jgi:tetratricopeptide (TPR) repeat protein